MKQYLHGFIAARQAPSDQRQRSDEQSPRLIGLDDWVPRDVMQLWRIQIRLDQINGELANRRGSQRVNDCPRQNDGKLCFRNHKGTLGVGLGVLEWASVLFSLKSMSMRRVDPVMSRTAKERLWLTVYQWPLAGQPLRDGQAGSKQGGPSALAEESVRQRWSNDSCQVRVLHSRQVST